MQASGGSLGTNQWFSRTPGFTASCQVLGVSCTRPVRPQCAAAAPVGAAAAGSYVDGAVCLWRTACVSGLFGAVLCVPLTRVVGGRGDREYGTWRTLTPPLPVG